MTMIMRGTLHGQGKKIGVVVSRFNEFITKRLLESALEALGQTGVRSKDIQVVWVPGALEIPLFCKKLALSKKKPDGILALGCILRGGTFHYEVVCYEAVRGISQAALETGIPAASGIITADTLEEAIDRAGLKSGNKGAQAALTLIEIINLAKRIS